MHVRVHVCMSVHGYLCEAMFMQAHLCVCARARAWGVGQPQAMSQDTRIRCLDQGLDCSVSPSPSLSLSLSLSLSVSLSLFLSPSPPVSLFLSLPFSLALPCTHLYTHRQPGVGWGLLPQLPDGRPERLEKAGRLWRPTRRQPRPQRGVGINK